MIIVDRSCALEFEFPFPGSLISTFLNQVQESAAAEHDRAAAQEAQGGQDPLRQQTCQGPRRTLIIAHAPYTLHPTPYTLHPTPYTLRLTGGP